jgi:hypothetical protein
MTQDEIIEMANEAFDESSFTDAEVLRFANLVAAKEREACARVCERTKGLDRGGWPQHYEAHELAAAIRARGQA